MSCPSCAQDNRTEFQSEMMPHFSGVKSQEVPGILLFPKLLVCLDCGAGQAKCVLTSTGLLMEGLRRFTSGLSTTLQDIRASAPRS